MEYKIITGNDPLVVQSQVNELLALGWAPQGSLSTCQSKSLTNPINYSQALWRNT